MSDAPVKPRRIRRQLALPVGAALAVGLSVLASPPSAAAPVPAFHHVSVQVGSAGQITQVTRSTVSLDAEGLASDESEEIAPLDAVTELPVRIQTAWWAEEESGTDLAELAGRSGRLAIQVTVENLTMAPTEVSYEADGRRYRQQGLVGVPMTVSASTVLGETATLVTSGAALVTDGQVTIGADGAVSVQWGRLLAPPLLSATASFTLVVDASEFVPPAFEIAVQPGLVTDPAVGALLERGLGPDGETGLLESSTIQLVSGVDTQLTEALGFIDQTHAALQGDVAEISRDMVSELRGSAELVLSHLESMQSQMASLKDSTTSGLGRVVSQTKTEVAALLNSLKTLLGSTKTPPRMVDATVDGCAVVLPRLALNQPTTIAASVFLIDAQLRALAEAFEDQTADGATAASQNCRSALTSMIAAGLGDPAELTSPEGIASCEATPVEDRTVTCSIHLAETSAADGFGAVRASVHDQVESWQGELGVDRLLASLGPDGLGGALAGLLTRTRLADAMATATVQDVRTWVGTVDPLVKQATRAVGDAETALTEIIAGLADLRSAFEDTRALVGSATLPLLSDPTSTPPSLDELLTQIADRNRNPVSVGQWFIDSGLVDAILGLGQTDSQDALDATASPPPSDPCPSTWADGLEEITPESSLAEIRNALAAVENGCPGHEVAAAARLLAEGYATMTEAMALDYSDASAAQGNVAELDAQMSTLDEAITEVESLLDEATDSLPMALGRLYRTDDDPTAPATGLLVDIQDELDQLKAMLAPANGTTPAGDLAGLVGFLDELAATVASIWPDNSVMPVSDAAACSSEGTVPNAPGQAVVHYANRVFCANAGVDLTSFDLDLARISSRTEAALQEASDRTAEVSSTTSSQIGSMSDRLAAALTGQRDTAMVGTLEMIDDTRASTETDVGLLLDQYGLGTDEVIASLGEAMTAAGTETASVRRSLSAEFTTLIANLGGADPWSRSGLIGKLYGISSQVGQTGGMLAHTQSTVAAYGAARSAEVRDLYLAAAQHDASLARLADYHPFGGKEDEALTVFLYHLVPA